MILYLSLYRAAVIKRGVCTFVEKSNAVKSSGAQFVLVINTEDKLLDLPAGKEKTDDLNMYVGVTSPVVGNLLLLGSTIGPSLMNGFAEKTNPLNMNITAQEDVIAILVPVSRGDKSQLSPACTTLQTVARDVLDALPRSNFPAQLAVTRYDQIDTLKVSILLSIDFFYIDCIHLQAIILLTILWSLSIIIEPFYIYIYYVFI